MKKKALVVDDNRNNLLLAKDLLEVAPENLELKWEWKDGIARVEVPRVEIHSVVVVE